MDTEQTLAPSVDDYDTVAATFRWDDAWTDVGGPPGDSGLNIADRAVDRHVRDGHGDDLAIRFLRRDDDLDHPVDITYRSLAAQTDRFARALRRHGHGPGTGVATLAGRIPELYVAALGTLKARAVYTPLFSAFGPEPIAQRVALGHIEVLVTTPLLHRRKIVPILDQLPTLRLIVLAAGTDEVPAGDPEGPAVVSFREFLGDDPPDWEAEATDPEAPALVHFTSGTTGQPKGAVHVHGALLAHQATGRMVLDLRPGDVYWCTADPGWVTGTSYGIISPLLNRVTSIIDEADFDADRWYRILVSQGVNVLYTAPTAIRMLERLDDGTARSFPDLRVVASVGEPLDADGVRWCQDTFRVPVLDSWWQTETGAIMIANLRSAEVRPGSMGRPVPGVDVGLLDRDEEGELRLDADGGPIVLDGADVQGELAIATGWPSMFRTYLDQEERYRSCFVDGWYRSGDLARRDADGYYWFVGRGDDVIKTAGHLIGPFEVENVLDEHPAVVESGVIGKPDEVAGNIIKAFVVLKPGYAADAQLERDIHAHARRRLGAAVAPREIEITDALPHTRSGKIMRRVLKARELGLDEGDTSTLEGDST